MAFGDWNHDGRISNREFIATALMTGVLEDSEDNQGLNDGRYKGGCSVGGCLLGFAGVFGIFWVAGMVAGLYS